MTHVTKHGSVETAVLLSCSVSLLSSVRDSFLLLFLFVCSFVLFSLLFLFCFWGDCFVVLLLLLCLFVVVLNKSFFKSVIDCLGITC